MITLLKTTDVNHKGADRLGVNLSEMISLQIYSSSNSRFKFIQAFDPTKEFTFSLLESRWNIINYCSDNILSLFIRRVHDKF